MYSNLLIAVNGMELVPLSSYTIEYLAYPIEKGRLYADVKFHTEDWVLKADNKFYVEQLVLGAKDKTTRCAECSGCLRPCPPAGQ